jgi:hypothetical protein
MLGLGTLSRRYPIQTADGRLPDTSARGRAPEELS